jgi:hypothetical protein
MADWLDEAESLFAEPDMSAMFTPAPAAPAPTQLQSLINQPNRAPTNIELGVAQLRAMLPLEQAAADIEGRKLLFQEGLSFGVLPKIGAAATSLKEALYGTPITEAFGQAVTQQDILKEFVKQQALEKDNLIFGLTGPELAGGLVSPIGRLYTPAKVAAGTPLASALATRGLNIGKAAGTGAGAAGLQTFLSTPGTLEERLAAAEGAAETGAMFGGGFGALGEGLSAGLSKLEAPGMGLQRKARGARVSDYKLAKNAIIETVEGDTTTQLKKSFDNLIEKGTLGKSIDPESMYPKLQAAKEAAEDSIQSVLKGAEAKVGPVPSPSFDKTLEYISKNIAANDVDKYLNEVISFQDALRREGKGSLVYLNQQKKIVGENWKNSPQSDPGFWRSFYKDMKEHIEKYAPEVKDLNKQKQDLIVVSPIIERGFKATGADYDIGKVMQLLYTSGGAGLAGGAILGAATGDTEAGILGALTLRGLATPKGQNLLGRGLQKAAQGASNIGTKTATSGLLAGQLASRPEIELIPRKAAVVEEAAMPETGDWLNEAESLFVEPTPAPAPESVKVGKQNISIPTGKEFAPPSLVKAVMKVESGGKQEAVSPKGATGLMQLMPGTARELGVDPKDPKQNVEGGSKYLQKQLKSFGNTELALAAYNWGPGKVRAAIDDAKSKDWDTIVKRLGVRYQQNSKLKGRKGAPKHEPSGVPEETYLYVDKVLSNQQKA